MRQGSRIFFAYDLQGSIQDAICFNAFQHTPRTSPSLQQKPLIYPIS
jgi:hypothetical protein